MRQDASIADGARVDVVEGRAPETPLFYSFCPNRLHLILYFLHVFPFLCKNIGGADR